MSGVSSPSLWQEIFPTNGAGTDASAGATTVDSAVLPPLGVNDKLRIVVTLESVTQQTASALIYDVTNATQIGYLYNDAAILAGGIATQDVTLALRQGSTTLAVSMSIGGTTANATIYKTGGFTVASWTAGFTLGLRHTGVTAGGTFKYRWQIYIQRG